MKRSGIPRGWQWKRVADLIEKFDAGISVNGGDRPAIAGECGVLKISAITEGRFREIENKVIEGVERERVSLHPKRDRIIISRANTPELIGANAYIERDYPDVFLSDKLWQLEPKEAHTISMRWLGFVLGSPSYRKKMSEIATGSSQSMKNISQDAVMKLELPVPPHDEQVQLATLLVEWDFAIDKTELLIDAKISLLCNHRESLIARKNGFVRVKLSAVTRESTARNGTLMGRDAIMAVTKSEGLRPMREETISASIDRYKIVKPKSFAYNPMRINIGSIAMSSFKHDVLVSPDYVVFECDPTKLIPGYLSHLRRTSLWSQFFDAAGSGGVRIRIYYADLAAFSFPLPSLAEQARVVTQLDLAALEIETLTRYVAALKSQKRGLMQKLLTGQWRVPLSVNEASEVRA